MHPASLLLLAALAVGVLIALVSIVRLHAAIALSLVALAMGVAAGMSPLQTVQAFEQGVGATLGSIALVIALGAILSALLARSGGAEMVAAAAVSNVSRTALPWAVTVIGFVLGTPVFFAVGLVLLVPIVAQVAAAAAVPALSLALPLVAGLSVTHGLLPPHPGPLAAIGLLGADPGQTLLYGLIVAVPATIVSGPVFATVIVPRLGTRRTAPTAPGAPDPRPARTAARRPTPPGLAATIVTMLLPVILMLAGSLGTIAAGPGPMRSASQFVGSPLVAMLAAVVAGYYVFGVRTGIGRAELLALTEESLTPIATILLIVAAGGGFGRVLDQAGVGRAIAGAAASLHLSPFVVGWTIAVLFRLGVGSATVAVTTAAGMMAPIIVATPGVSRELMVVALGAGALIASHVNDGGFWLVKEYLDLSVPEALATWTVLETIIAVLGLASVLALSTVVG
jgi:GntP family gluconate:H+ symporter